ncbi:MULTISPECIES: hypothetical protein [Salinibaculum]|uniref:hypothetical protein n=1 Tax=Salinibaculum TaxID=2732368 RepID=UPI0030D0D386
MAQRTGILRSRLLGGNQPTDGKMVEALESRLAEDEPVVHQLASTGALVHEQDDETRQRGGSDGGTLLAATDRKLVFVIDTKSGRETADIPYTDVKRIEREDGILSTTVVLTVWGRGTFRLKPTSADGVDDLVGDVTALSRTWQLVVAALQDARQHISLLEERVERGEMDDAEESRQSAREHIETATGRIDVDDTAVRQTLQQRVRTVRTELRRTVSRARMSRGRDLVEEADGLADRRAYDAAHRCLRQAREHFERALDVAIEEDFETADDLRADLDDLADRERTLQGRPLERAEAARERAQAAAGPAEEAIAWEEALAHYRDALEAGWGTDATFDGDTDALRMQIEWVVANLVDARMAIAEALEWNGDRCRDRAQSERARTRYAVAREHLAVARRLAAQYHTGDVATLDERAARLCGKRLWLG